MSERKKGEQEAITILKNLGIEVDNDYYDDNSHKSMPDIKCKDGRYIEVTHTHHNNAIPTTISRFDKLQPGEDWSGYAQRHLAVETECSNALTRINMSNPRLVVFFKYNDGLRWKWDNIDNSVQEKEEIQNKRLAEARRFCYNTFM